MYYLKLKVLSSLHFIYWQTKWCMSVYLSTLHTKKSSLSISKKPLLDIGVRGKEQNIVFLHLKLGQRHHVKSRRKWQVLTDGSPASPIPIAQTRELLPVPLGPMTRLTRSRSWLQVCIGHEVMNLDLYDRYSLGKIHLLPCSPSRNSAGVKLSHSKKQKIADANNNQRKVEDRERSMTS